MPVNSWRRLLLLAILGACACVGIWFWLRRLGESGEETSYHLIEEGLYLGSSVARPPPDTSAVVNLCGREDPYKVDASLWEPILEGGKPPDVAWLKRVVGFIDAQRRARRTVYVHCLAGVDRSAMVVTAYLMFEHGWDRDTALGHVKAGRPQAHPDPTFMQLLADWGGTLDASEPRMK
jgi:hypothetical protein